ncbi:MAG TPA: SdrD B-like domain-containing protein [Candidatus Angelobacter sp.]|nr:SdrD B-like domain-containing protein [Candidatus Angelobacter sp.]
MTGNNARTHDNWIKILLFSLALLLLTAIPAHAADTCPSAQNNGVIDGFVNPVPPAQINIQGNCTIRNFPASNPLTSNISFFGNNATSFLVIFDNVDFIGNISCDKPQGNAIWFVNGSTTTVRPNCQNLFIPVEKIDKQNPAGQTTATIGVPFTYKLTVPVLFDPLNGIVVNNQGSPNDLHDITITDDLNATGADLSYVSHTVTWVSNGTPVPHTFSNVGNVLTFSGFPIVPAKQQFVINITVVLNDTPTNVPGKQFFNTANWQFGRLINGTFFTPLPGEKGVAPPMTIAAPNLVLTKSGPATMALGQPGQFGLDILNNGTSDAWSVTILDQLPKSGPTGGMCSSAPQILSAQVFQNGAPVAGKGPLAPGTDFTSNFDSTTCQLTLTMLTAAAAIGANQDLIITYRTQLDANSQVGTQLTNVAGAIQWFDGDPSVSTRKASTRTLTDGTPGVLDFQDAHTVTVVVNPLTITKQVSVVGGGPALPGGQLDYLVHVTNVSTSAVTPVVITDDLSTAGPGRLTFVNPAATMNGSTNGVTIAGSVLTANYSAVNPTTPLQPGQTIDVRFRAQIAAGLPAGTTLTNTAVVTWNTPPETASASVSIDIGGVPGVGTLNGTAWLDANFNKVPDLGEPRLQGWTVALFRNGVQLQSVLTDVNGVYRFSNVPPTDGTPERYEVRFTAPGAGPNTAKLGKADSAFTNSLQRITDIAVPSGSNILNLNLPIGPNGVIYNSLTRAPISGMTVFMLNAGGRSPLPAACFDDQAQQGQITQAGGYYRFDLNFTDPACSSGSNFVIKVVAPSSTFVAGESLVIPPASDASTAAFSVPTCPGGLQDALPAVPYCEAQGSEFAPPSSVAPRSTGTAYYLNLTLDGTSVPGSNQIYNNHIPVDPQIAGSFSITKTTPLLNVTRGQLVPYTITIGNVLGASMQGVQIVDRYPAGFRYVTGSARLDGVPTEPTATAGQLVWNGLNFGSSDHRTIMLLLVVGAGVNDGEFTNRAQVFQGVTGQPLSGEATATVRVVPDQTFDCTDVLGKVFDDVNRNGRQDPGEKGLPGVRLVTAQGLTAITDQYGRFHITCAIVPNEIRGSNFVLKLDDRTLPSGFRLSTDQLQIKHATAGKALKFDFGASIYRVVAIDLSDAVFEPGSTEIRIQWRPRVDVLLGELRKAPSVLRLSYVADTEDAALVERRMQAVKRQLTEAWDTEKDSYVLTIEPEVFWRRGAPPQKSDMRVPESR